VLEDISMEVLFMFEFKIYRRAMIEESFLLIVLERTTHEGALLGLLMSLGERLLIIRDRNLSMKTKSFFWIGEGEFNCKRGVLMGIETVVSEGRGFVIF